MSKFKVGDPYIPGLREINTDTPIDMSEAVDHPAHYTAYAGIEVIQLTEQMGFMDGNVVKYVARAPFKGNALEDYRKAQWYLSRLIANLENQ